MNLIYTFVGKHRRGLQDFCVCSLEKKKMEKMTKGRLRPGGILPAVIKSKARSDTRLTHEKYTLKQESL